MSRWSRARALLLGSLTALTLALACDTGGLVGGKCRTGALFCDGECIDPSTDSNHCGSCATRCDSGELCTNGVCQRPSGDGGAPTSGGSGGTANAGSGNDNGGGGAIGGDAGAPSAGGGADTSGGTSGNPQGGNSNSNGADGGAPPCGPPYNTPEHCGDCDTQCAEPTPWCIPDNGGSYFCSPSCPPGYTQCGDECVDTQSSALHCGRCFHVCPSLRCIDGTCAGATPGHIALYCMDYVFAQSTTAHTRLLGNALFLLPPSDNVRILAFTAWAPSSVRAQVNKVIGWEATHFGRTYTVDGVKTADDVNSALDLANYDVFLVYEQSDAPAGRLATLGDQLASTLESFTIAGGVVIVLDGAQGTDEMPEFVSSAGLLDITGHTPIAIDDTSTSFYVQSRLDQLASTVVSPLSPAPYSCTFETSASPAADTSFVVTDAEPPALGNPVVIHRIVAP